jgi:ectoine hydroxylase-related dioxygenase (phytanoyl-CoA dioxygenase family)
MATMLLEPQTAPATALSRAEIDRWHEQGFLGPYTLVTPEEMARSRAIIDEQIFAKDQRPDSQRLHDRHLDLPEVWRLCSHPALVERVASLIGPDLILWRTNFQLKAAGGDGVPWHQDGAYYGLEPCVLVSAWIAVDEATRENGCLQVIPGTHHGPIPHLVDSSKSAFGKEIDRGALDLVKAVSFTLQPGQFVLFNENTAHGSEPNCTTGRRLGLSPRITVPFVRVMPQAPGVPRPVSLLRGRDYLGLNRLMPPPA